MNWLLRLVPEDGNNTFGVLSPAVEVDQFTASDYIWRRVRQGKYDCRHLNLEGTRSRGYPVFTGCDFVASNVAKKTNFLYGNL